MIATYNGYNNAFLHNLLFYGNTAGIYVACNGGCEDQATIWDNEIHDFRERGIDLDSLTNGWIVTNTVKDIGGAPGLANVSYSNVQWNTLYRGGDGTYDYGALVLRWGANNNSVSDNELFGSYGGSSHTQYAVYFEAADRGYSDPYDNEVTDNDLWAGSGGHIGGTTTGNTISPNGIH